MDSTTRFSDRVSNYVKYRPGYPAAVIPYLQDQVGLTAHTVIADIGSGTGILTELFLKNGNQVLGVEPNTAMRSAAETILTDYGRFMSVAGTAEATNLAAESIDLVTAGQAFHWFDFTKSRQEFTRILKDGGHAALVWNSRLQSGPFMGAYEQLVSQFANDYESVGERNVTDEHIAGFFHPQAMLLQTFENEQLFDFDGLKGRALSSSYSPAPNHPAHEAFIEQLRQLFDQHETEGTVRFAYETRIYCGRLR